MKYVDVVLPLPLKGTFTYAVPPEWEQEVRTGMRVVVQFGSKKLYTAIVAVVHTHAPSGYEPREISCLLDSYPIIRRPQYRFWEWISEYYMAPLGDVYNAALPAGFKLESETEVFLDPGFEADEVLPAREQALLDVLQPGKALKIDDLARKVGVSNVMPVVKRLLDRGAVTVQELVEQKFRSKTVACVRLNERYTDEQRLAEVFDGLKRAPKQLDLLMRYIELSNCLKPAKQVEVSRQELLSQPGATPAVLGSLLEKEILWLYRKEVSRIESLAVTGRSFRLSEVQQKALQQVYAQFSRHAVVLLHGVTSSGKTELYIHMIERVLAEGRQVLYLVPEIALTTQLTSRLRRVFGNRLGVYHSRFSDNERVEIWNKVLHDRGYDVIIGVRSSVFLPFRQLGLVIVDEEHESSYKQLDPAPRYHARNAAIVLASMHGAKTLLGSATPAIESYYNTLNGKYGLVELHERHEEMELPEMVVVDMKEAYRKKQREGYFSDVLLDAIRSSLANKEQVILFQNRRGYAPFLECKACGHVPKCKNCDVSLTHHAVFNTLNCHYCGYTEPVPKACPACASAQLDSKGFGTERIEDEIKLLFPGAKVQRMDLDTTRSKKAYQRIIDDMEAGKVDILIGTQMVTKGLDFERVSLVGILNADNMLHFPDFRAHERAFQMIAQVSGRAGRRHRRGKVVVQTGSPGHPVIRQVLTHDYKAMFATQCQERQLFKYPPFYRMIQLTLKHKDAEVVSRASVRLAAELRRQFADRVAGPVVPVVSRIQNHYLRLIVLKVESGASVARVREILAVVMEYVLTIPEYKSVKISAESDV
ncbi:MAG: primosomal protein N' [Paludibacter sp. 47-17]|nr:MAG: primosomal protein N' [Paludibacter sp. SCN 50-10]ODU61909.1 MAG: primosomal protein N' [Paludibacter sp. SCN 51-9]OJX91229.1 MAG: primosomal protein N' [Paludibacter sp. 47-17]